MVAEPQLWRLLTVQREGVIIEGAYMIDQGGMLHVKTSALQKSSVVGVLNPHVLARILLRELAKPARKPSQARTL